ncbi:MAG: hypothetical protein WDZ85_02500 [Candidatus Paceibacterota bacterium]
MTKTTNNVPKDLSDTTGLLGFLNEKNQRLVSALYLVTEYVSDHDPIKWKMRELALAIMSDISSIRQKNSINESSDCLFDASATGDRIRELVSLIDVSLSAGSVSPMNFTLLKREYLKFNSLLSKLTDSVRFDAYLLADESARLSALPAPTHRPIGQPSDVVDNLSDRRPVTRPAESQPKTKPVPLTPAVKKDSGKNGRQDLIVAGLKGRGWLSIKDISDLLPAVGLKTLQRELTDMVDKNVLKKKGQRRWSRYALVGE